MIVAKNEDFIKYMPKLMQYSINLSRLDNKGYVNIPLAEDMLHDTYIIYNKRISKKPEYESYNQLFAHLRINLWQTYKRRYDKRQNSGRMYRNTYYIDVDSDKYYYTPEYNCLGFNIDKLTNHQKNVYYKIMDGYNQSEIAKEMNCSKQSINDTVKKIRKNIVLS